MPNPRQTKAKPEAAEGELPVEPGSAKSVKIGVISDTHNFLDPQVRGVFQGVNHILHAGDIGLPRILLELEQIAPVTAVAGNTDDAGFRYPETQCQILAGKRFLLHHIVNPHSITDWLRERMDRHKPDVVVFGHTHKPFCDTVGGTLFFNPGYAGKPRFGLARSIAILHCTANQIRPEYLPLFG